MKGTEGRLAGTQILLPFFCAIYRYSLRVITGDTDVLPVLDQPITLHSVLSVESLPDPSRTHVIGGTSRDFGISGFRFRVLHTHNQEVASAVSPSGRLRGVPGIAQYQLCRLLQDTGTESHPRPGSWLDLTATGAFLSLLGPLTALESTDTQFAVLVAGPEFEGGHDTGREEPEDGTAGLN
nr:probable inactive 1-aminocyclopropane-1-carboxylate synthase-like protein 2 isoform X1 [Vulpes vulpes]